MADQPTKTPAELIDQARRIVSRIGPYHGMDGRVTARDLSPLLRSLADALEAATVAVDDSRADGPRVAVRYIVVDGDRVFSKGDRPVLFEDRGNAMLAAAILGPPDAECAAVESGLASWIDDREADEAAPPRPPPDPIGDIDYSGPLHDVP